MLTGQFADKPTSGQSSRALVNSPIATFFQITEILHYTSTLNLT